MNTRLTGVFAALVTPFAADETILFDALQRHVDFLVNQGVDGFYVNGSTGESFLMSIEEREKVIEAVVEANAGRVAVINHCGAIGTGLSLQLVRHCEGLAIDAVSSVPPFYYGFSKEDLIGYYNDLANASDKPFIVYNMPKFSGVVITPSLMAELRTNKHIQGLKFTYNDFYALQQIKAADPDLIVYNGFDEMSICGMALGCDGAIGSTYNVLAPQILNLRNACLANDFKTALGIQTKMNEFITEMIKGGKLFAVLKYMISCIEGIDYGVCRKPFPQLTKEEQHVAEHLAQQVKELQNAHS